MMDPGRHKRLLLALRKKGMTQEGLAGHLTISRGAARFLIEGGGSGDKHLGKLADVLDVPLAWLMDGSNPPAWAKNVDAPTFVPSMPIDEAVELYSLKVGMAAMTKDVSPEKVRQYESLDERIAYPVGLVLSFEEHLALVLLLASAASPGAAPGDPVEPMSDRQRESLGRILDKIGAFYLPPGATKITFGIPQLLALARQVREAQLAFERVADAEPVTCKSDGQAAPGQHSK